MKWLQVALFAVVVLVANVSAFTDAEMRQRSRCYADYQCQDNCICHSLQPSGPKQCLCYMPNIGELQPACRRKEFL